MTSLTDPSSPFARDLAALREHKLRIYPPPPQPRPPNRIDVYNKLVAEARALGIRDVKQRKSFDNRRQAAKLIEELRARIEARRVHKEHPDGRTGR